MLHWRTQLEQRKFSKKTRILMFAAILLGMIASAAIGLSHVFAAGPTITVNKAIQYQQIDGFGGFGGLAPWFGNGPYYDSNFVNTVVDDLGATIIRDEVPPQFEQTQGAFDINATPSDSCHGQGTSLSQHIPYWQALQAEANAKGEPLKFIASVWSPPSWMKYVNCVFGGDHTWNRLVMSEIASASVPNDRRSDFAAFCVAYVKEMKKDTGIDVYALSVQNEPFFAQGYPSSVYSPEELEVTVRVVAQALRANGLSTKIFMPEDVTDFNRISSYFQYAENDPQTRPYVDYFAVHGYGADGVTGAGSQSFWTQAHNLAATYNVPLWQTETSGYSNDWTGAMQLGGSIYTALKYGQVGAWVWWALSDPTQDQYALMVNGNPTPLYYASKQFYRYIRPGAVMVDASSSDPDVLAVAFNHVQNKTMTVVLINQNGSSSKTMGLNFQGGNIPSQFTVYRSSSSENAANVGTVASNGSITLPPNSIVTLYGSSGSQDSLQAPSITSQPQNVSTNEGTSATFSVQATGSPTLQYQWQRNGSNIAGATGSIYTHPVVAADNNAQYRVVVSNGQGSVTSNVATLSVGSFSGANVAQATTAPTIDGNATDAVWSSATSYPISHATGSPSGYSASFQSAWDNSNLYLLVKVNDAGYAGSGDNVEVYLDSDNSKSKGYYDGDDWQYVFTWNSTTIGQYSGGDSGTNTAGIQFAQVAAGGGYQLEVKIPWSTLGASVSAGSIIGLDIAAVQATTTSNTGKLFWNATSNDDWHDPSLFGTAKLTSGSGGNPTPTPTPGNTPTPSPTPSGSWTFCANENQTCTFTGTQQVRYGANGTYAYQTATGSIGCNNSVFGDPLPGVVKHCDVSSSGGSTPTPTATPSPTPNPTPTGTPTSGVTVPNGGFETPNVGSGSYGAFQYTPSGASWTFAPQSGGDGAGISGNGSGFTSANPSAPEGSQVAFIQAHGSFSQAITFGAAGSYKVSFQAAQRGQVNTGNEDIQVLVDGNVVGTITASGTSYSSYSTTSFTVSAGSHTVQFKGVDSPGGDNTVFIDAVTIG